MSLLPLSYISQVVDSNTIIIQNLHPNYHHYSQMKSDILHNVSTRISKRIMETKKKKKIEDAIMC